MKAIEAKIKNLEQLINHLISDYVVLQKENAQLKAEVLKLEGQLNSGEEKIQNLGAEVERLRLARGLAGDPEEAKAAKAKLGSLMREIDRCIALLNE
jgi:cell division septum initiation protein DivIVA